MSAILPIFRHVNRTSISDSTQVQISLSDNPLYLIQAKNIIPSTDNVKLGGTFNETLGNYRLHTQKSSSVDTNYYANASTNNSVLDLFEQCGNDTGESLNLNMFIPFPSSTDLYKPIYSTGVMVNRQSNVTKMESAQFYSANTAALSTLELLMSSGNIASGIVDTFQLALYEATDIGNTFGVATLLDRQIATGAESYLNFDITGSYSRHVLVAIGVRLVSPAKRIHANLVTADGFPDGNWGRYHNTYSDNEDSSYNGLSNQNSSYDSYAFGMNNFTGQNASLFYDITTSGGYKIFNSYGAMVGYNNLVRICGGVSARVENVDPVVSFRIYPSVDNFESGTFLLYGIT